MTLQEIYSKYQIPPNLIRHQLQVAAVGKYVCDHWIGPEINRQLTIRTMLLHDLGNIVKFKLPFVGELELDASKWEAVQQEFIAKYGTNANEANKKILMELGFSEILKMLVQMEEVWMNPDMDLPWEARICEYGDCCVTLNGIEGFELRMLDLEKRYGHGPQTPIQQAMRQNAAQIQQHVNVDLSQLSSVDLSQEMAEVQQYTF